MNALEKYQEELKEDCSVDELNLKDMQMKLPAIKHKWVARLISEKITLNRLKSKKEAFKKKAIEAAQGKVELSRAALDRSLENSDQVKQLNEEIEDCELAVLYLEKVEKIMSAMTYDFRNIVQITQMETM